MTDYGAIYADYLASVVQSTYQRIGVGIVAKGVMAGDRPAAAAAPSGVEYGNPPLGSESMDGGSDGQFDGTNGTPVPVGALPSGFRRLADLRKRTPKQSYDDLKSWVGKTIRLDGVGFQTGEKNGKSVITSGTMTFSEFDPSNPDRETDQTVTTSIPRGALRALYEGLTKNPDDTIICDVVQSRRGLALQ